MWAASAWLIAMGCDARALPRLHTELGEKPGFRKWAQHHAKLLNTPIQRDVGVECGVALVQPGVML